MTKQSTVTIVAFLLSAAWLLLHAMQGFSFLDIGMYMSGYQYFNAEPRPSFFLGQWLMSYECTGWLTETLHLHGYYALRVMRVVWFMVLQAILFVYLKRYLPWRYLIIALAMSTLAQQGSYAEINYNDYSALWLILSLLAMHQALTGSKRALAWYMASGCMAGIAIFFRLTNLTFLALPFYAIIITAWMRRPCTPLKMLTGFFTGALLGIATAVAIIFATGMGDVLRLTVNSLTGMSSNAGDPHNLKSVLFGLYGIYKGQVQGIAVIIFLYLIYIILNRRTTVKAMHYTLSLVLAAAIVFCVYFHEPTSNITVGICWLAFLAVFAHPDKQPEQGSLLALAMFQPLFLPIGTNGGPEFIGQDLAFLPLPMALFTLKNSWLPAASDQQRLHARARIVTLTGIFLALLYTDVKRPMMEDGNRIECHYALNSTLTRHIYTTQQNADTLNALTSRLNGVLPKGSYLICNFNIPLISLLDCKPFGVYATLYSSIGMCQAYVSEAQKSTGVMPYLLINKAQLTPKDRELTTILRSKATYARIWKWQDYELWKPKETKK